MKQLKLIRVDINRANARFRYEIYQDGKKLCSRQSNRVYVACYVEQTAGAEPNREFSATHFFSRPELIGKGLSSRCKPYGLATLQVQPVTA